MSWGNTNSRPALFVLLCAGQQQSPITSLLLHVQLAHTRTLHKDTQTPGRNKKKMEKGWAGSCENEGGVSERSHNLQLLLLVVRNSWTQPSPNPSSANEQRGETQTSITDHRWSSCVFVSLWTPIICDPMSQAALGSPLLPRSVPLSVCLSAEQTRGQQVREFILTWNFQEGLKSSVAF